MCLVLTKKSIQRPTALPEPGKQTGELFSLENGNITIVPQRLPDKNKNILDSLTPANKASVINNGINAVVRITNSVAQMFEQYQKTNREQEKTEQMKIEKDTKLGLANEETKREFIRQQEETRRKELEINKDLEILRVEEQKIKTQSEETINKINIDHKEQMELYRQYEMLISLQSKLVNTFISQLELEDKLDKEKYSQLKGMMSEITNLAKEIPSNKA